MGRPTKLELDEVLKRATNLLWMRGCDAVSTRDLEAALGLRAPAIYRRFRSKDELLAQCVEYYVNTIVSSRIQRWLVDANDPLRGLHDFFTSTLEPHKNEPTLRGCLLANTAAHADAQVPQIRAAIHRGWDLMHSAFHNQVVRAQQAGQINPHRSPEALSKALLISLQGLLTLARAGADDLQLGIDATFSLLAQPAQPPSFPPEERENP